MVAQTPCRHSLVDTRSSVGSGFGLFKVGTEFLPPTDEGFFSISVKMPNGSSLSSTNEVVKRIESKLKEEEDIDVYVSLVGGTQQSMAQGGSESDRAEIYVKLVPLSERDRSVFEFVDEVQPEVLGHCWRGCERQI